ncbi:MAG: hypothetical protein M3Q80_02100, partial [bacterium]|nr:hypothetical protein [bacterium]
KPQQQAVESMIPSNSFAVVNLEKDLTPFVIQTRIENEVLKTQTPNTIKEIILSAKDSSGVSVRVSATEIIDAMEIDAPDILTRSLTPDWMLGVYNDENDEKSVFVVTSTNFFQNTFAGMLQWESVMADDLRKYLSPASIKGISNSIKNPSTPMESTTTATTTATSTGGTTATTTMSTSSVSGTNSARTAFVLRGRFVDKIIKNKDVRAFQVEDGTILFLYSFIDNTHLVITDKESTLSEILSRLEKQSFIR